MNVIGKWKIAAVLTVNDKLEQIWKTVEELAADPDEDSFDIEMLESRFIFGEDGVIKTIIQIPDEVSSEEIEEAVKSGECEIYAPGFITIEKRNWKEENGKFMFDSGIDGEILDEKIDPWTEIIPTENGIQYGTFRLIREE